MSIILVYPCPNTHHIHLPRENEDIILNLIKIHVIKIIHACRLMLPQNKCLHFENIIVMVNLQSNFFFFT